MLLPFISKTRMLCPTARHFYLASFYCSKTPIENPSPRIDDIHRQLYVPNNFDKKMLVWTGRYKTLDEVPGSVPVASIVMARNKLRIKVANFMMAATVFACMIMVYTGKRAADKGESVAKMNLDWHKQINEDTSK